MALPLVPIIGVGIVALIALASKGGSSKAALPSGTFTGTESGNVWYWRVVEMPADKTALGSENVRYYKGEIKGPGNPDWILVTPTLRTDPEEARLLCLEALGQMDEMNQL